MRKKLSSFLLACAVAMSTMPTTACNSQTVLTDLQRYAPVVTNLLTVACEFTPGAPLCSTGAALLTAAEQHVFSLWQAYLTAQARGTATPGLWADLNAALDTLISNSVDVFSLTRVVDAAHQKDVLDMAAAVQALLAVIESLLPANPGAVKTMAMARPSKLATFLPKPNPKSGKFDSTWLRSWEKNYNSLAAVQAHGMQVKSRFLGL